MPEIGIPLGYIGLGEAYEQALRRLCNVEALVAGMGPWKRESRSWQRALAEWQTMHAKALAEGRPDDYPNPADYPRMDDPEAMRAYDDALEGVERRMRTAIARGELDAFHRDPRTGQVLRGLDRESWTERMSPSGLGLSNDIHNATCPGPVELEGRFVFLDVKQFEEWLEQEVAANRTRPVSEHDLEAAYLERVKQIGAGRSSLKDDLEAMNALFPQKGMTRAQVANLRRKYAPGEWKAPGKRKR
jgi:hypothetical protein